MSSAARASSSMAHAPKLSKKVGQHGRPSRRVLSTAERDGFSCVTLPYFFFEHDLCSDNPRRLQRQAEEVAADHLENRELRLRLLRHRVHVAEAALERINFEDRRGAGREIGGLGDLPGLLAG